MKIVVQNLATKLFVGGNRPWTSQAEDARQFEDKGTAEEYCRENRLSRVQLIIKLNNLPDIRLPIAV